MIRNNYIYISVSAFIAIVFLGPFLYITQFTYYSGDDICRVTLNFQNFFNEIYRWYFNHNGRYTNAFISYLPVYNIHLYRIILAISFIILCVSYFAFLDSLFSFFRFIISKYKIAFLAVLTSIMSISLLPSIFEFFYWFAGTSAYMYSIILLLFLMVRLLKSNLQPKKFDTLLVSCLILLIGNNEMLLLFINFMLIVVFVFNYLKSKDVNNQLFLLNIFSWVSSLAVIFSPGSSKRQSFYAGGGDFFFSLKSAVLSSGMFLLKKMIEFPNIIFFSGIILFLYHIKVDKNRFSIRPVLLGVLSFLALVSIFFVPYYAIGHLNVNEGRIGNMIHLVFLILMLINVVNFSIYLKLKLKKMENYSLIISLNLFAFFLLLTGFFNRNYNNLIADFNSNEFQRFEQELNYRRFLIKNSSKAVLKVEKVNGTRTIKYYDLSKDPTHWSNECYTEIINSTYNKDLKSIVID